MKCIALGLAALAATAPVVCAEALKPPHGHKWLVLGSSPDPDTAIGMARSMKDSLKNVRVVKVQGGALTVVAGPYPFTDLAKFKKSAEGQSLSHYPPNTALDKGGDYVETIWRAKPDPLNLKNYALNKPADFKAGPLQLRVSAERFGKGKAYTKISGKGAQGPVRFEIGKDLPGDQQQLAKYMTSENYYRAGLVQLARGAASKQLVVTSYSGGAHCCTLTHVFGPDSQNHWVKDQSLPRDGEGFTYEDLDGDGAMELVSVDNRFLYAFDSYAGSFAPIQVFKWRDGKLADVTLEPAYRARLKQDLAAKEWDVKLRPGSEKYNGYLAGWVAAKIRLGQGDEAWAAFMKTYDRSNTFGPQVCTTGQKMEDCPEGNEVAIPIPKALAAFLQESGYTPLPAAAEAELKSP